MEILIFILKHNSSQVIVEHKGHAKDIIHANILSFSSPIVKRQAEMMEHH